MTLDDVRELARFRSKYRGLTWDQLGLLFGVSGSEAREQWLVATEDGGQPLWWRAARDLWSEGMGYKRIGHALGKPDWTVRAVLRRMGLLS
jgi:hypothetical protein